VKLLYLDVDDKQNASKYLPEIFVVLTTCRNFVLQMTASFVGYLSFDET
jgi:hypothetical protein